MSRWMKHQSYTLSEKLKMITFAEKNGNVGLLKQKFEFLIATCNFGGKTKKS